MADNQGFAQRLRQLRKEKGFSQTKLAEQVGVHYTHIGRYEKAAARPGADTLFKLADALDVSPSFLIEGSTDEIAQDRLSDRELLVQFEQIEKFPEEDKSVVKRLIGAFIAEKRLQELVVR